MVRARRHIPTSHSKARNKHSYILKLAGVTLVEASLTESGMFPLNKSQRKKNGFRGKALD